MLQRPSLTITVEIRTRRQTELTPGVEEDQSSRRSWRRRHCRSPPRADGGPSPSPRLRHAGPAAAGTGRSAGRSSRTTTTAAPATPASRDTTHTAASAADARSRTSPGAPPAPNQRPLPEKPPPAAARHAAEDPARSSTTTGRFRPSAPIAQTRRTRPSRRRSWLPTPLLAVTRSATPQATRRADVLPLIVRHPYTSADPSDAITRGHFSDTPRWRPGQARHIARGRQRSRAGIYCSTVP